VRAPNGCSFGTLKVRTISVWRVTVERCVRLRGFLTFWCGFFSASTEQSLFHPLHLHLRWHLCIHRIGTLRGEIKERAKEDFRSVDFLPLKADSLFARFPRSPSMSNGLRHGRDTNADTLISSPNARSLAQLPMIDMRTGFGDFALSTLRQGISITSVLALDHPGDSDTAAHLPYS